MRGCAGRVHLKCLIRGYVFLFRAGTVSVVVVRSHDMSKLVMALARVSLINRPMKGKWSLWVSNWSLWVSIFAGGSSGHTRCGVSTGSGFVSSQ
jgi:hypothetical protein